MAEPRTVTVAPSRLERWLAGFAERHGQISASVADSAVRIDAPDGAQALISLPWPDPDFGPDPLVGVVREACRSRRLGVLVVRRERHVVGIWQTDSFAEVTTGRHYVQGRTKAGGWSQQRYARRRADQARRAFADAAADAAAVLTPAVGHLDALVTGGDAGGIDAVLHDAKNRALAELAARVEVPRLAVSDPTKAAVTSAMTGYFQARIWLNELA